MELDLIISTILILLFSSWTIATIIYHFPNGNKYFTKIGILSFFIPQWNFFAPTPGTNDFYLLYREKLSNDFCSSWVEVNSFNRKRNLISIIWNPYKIEKKALLDFALEINKESKNISKENINYVKLSMPYLLILNYISNLSHFSKNNTIQFMIMKKSSFSDSIDPFFISGFHQLE